MGNVTLDGTIRKNDNMVTYVQNKKARIATAITSISADLPYDLKTQKECVRQWSDTIKRVIVMGNVEPESREGVRQIKANSKVPIANLIGSYMYQVPGNEILILAAPNVKLGGRQDDLVGFVSKQRMELAWCGAVKSPHGKAFVMSSGLIPHLMRDMPLTLTLADDWFKWMDDWMTVNMQKHRYFDATEYGIVLTPEITTPIEVPQAPANLKKKSK